VKIKSVLASATAAGLLVTGMAHADGTDSSSPNGSTDQATVGQKLGGFFKSLGSKVQSDLQGRGGGGPQPGSVDILDTKLDNLLGKNPSTSSADPEWPRIALSNIVLPESALGPVPIGTGLRFTSADCIYFKATIWSDAKTSEVLDKVAACGSDMQRRIGNHSTASGMQETDMTFPVIGTTTGRSRTEGPTPPGYLIDQNVMDNVRRGNRTGVTSCVELIETLVGFDPRSDMRRFWVVNFTNFN
jgi:hypothetical protein